MATSCWPVRSGSTGGDEDGALLLSAGFADDDSLSGDDTEGAVEADVLEEELAGRDELTEGFSLGFEVDGA